MFYFTDEYGGQMELWNSDLEKYFTEEEATKFRLELSEDEKDDDDDEGLDSDLEELKEAYDKMEQLLFDIEDILSRAPVGVRTRAKSYWLAHMKIELNKDHEFLAGSMCTMQDTINQWTSISEAV